ncbi:flagellar hook capping FlgD N-terminal domain-containing protein [Sphingomonas sp. HITSZ_GF]|uniref:flagellar hook assembly protein FlgD n=1 Tax=Sphingomonas sp. HITSZ_GF TaxID=3037247 RepID=UPI00240DFD76|nr:flagellar hook capping FlgD N-terminal domain-containing protein [Sphingomonas sp. HITSZ_GF]MDG2533728.1 flagellar hook capping FlgD N-terminal domain-containing protein [Sphingomonas sp. HITSZ_GF]
MSDFDTTLSSLGITRYDAGTTSTTGTTLNNTTDTSQLGTTDMDVSDFLALMTAQLKNQDPFEPVDNSQMVAQMAQFSSLSGITEMSSTLKTIASQLSTTSLNDAIGYVGKTVLVEGSTAYPRTSGGLAGAVALADDATNVTVTIKDADGNTLKTIEMGAQDSGAVAWEWDGTTDSGEAAGDGPFTVSTIATDGTGNVSSAPLVWAPVSAVSMGSDGKPVLSVTGVGNITTDAIWQVG